MARTGIQLYSLRNVNVPFTDLLEIAADAGFQGVEYAHRVQETSETVKEITTTLDERGLASVGAHVGISTLEEETAATAEFYRSLGCDDVVVPWLDAEHFETRRAVEATATRLESLADDLRAHGMNLHYHNHDQEFTDLGRTTGFEYLLEQTDDRVGIELDAGLALAAGADLRDLVSNLDGRTALFHAKDIDLASGEDVPVGEGDLDIASCARGFQAVGGKWLIYEYEQPDARDTLDAANAVLTDAL